MKLIPSTLNPQPSTLNPQPSTLNPISDDSPQQAEGADEAQRLEDVQARKR